MIGSALAGSATWKTIPIDNNWNNPLNWIPETVPMSEGDVATFGVSTITDITTSTFLVVSSIVFEADASAFTITPAIDNLEIHAPGIVNNSGTLQTFVCIVNDDGTSRAIPFVGATAAANTMFITQARRTNFGDGGDVEFDQHPASASMATIINEGGETDGSIGGHTLFFGRAMAGEATIIANGGTVSGAGGGQIEFIGPTAAASNSILIANGGSNGGGGGEISFYDNCTGDNARVELFGNGTLTLISTGVMGLSIGSLEGEGIVNLSAFSLSVGANSLSTTFSGVIQDDNFGPGSLTKIGTGVLTLSGANTYRKSTDVNAGTLVLTNTTGSGAGTGPLRINAGTLGGSGIITGTVTIGTGSGAGAFLAPATGANKKVTLTIQSSLTFNSDATYTYTFKAKRNKARADLVIANGVTINSGASFQSQRPNPGQLATRPDSDRDQQHEREPDQRRLQQPAGGRNCHCQRQQPPSHLPRRRWK